MNLDDRRLLLDREFHRTIDSVLNGFLHEGFTVRPVDAGDLHARAHPGCSMRYAVLDVTLPELAAAAGLTQGAMPLPSCRISVFELQESCTLVTIENRLARYPLLAWLARRNADRIGEALRLIVRDEPGCHADVWR